MGIAAFSLLTRPYLADEDRAPLQLAYSVPYGRILNTPPAYVQGAVKIIIDQEDCYAGRNSPP